jgi:4-hydroxy-tetrahydrodipicolinate synthase
MPPKFRGIIPAVLTPFGPGGSVNEDELHDHLDFLIGGGVHALFPVGTTGEGPVMSVALRKRVAELAVDHVGGRVPVLIHTGAVNTVEAVELTVHASSIGADAASLITPFYYVYDEASLFRHYVAVAESVPGFPIFLYNNPSKAVNAISPGLFARLRGECENVIGVKDTSGSVQNIQEYVAVAGEDGIVLTGSNTLILASLAVGSAGAISTIANVFPEMMVEMYESFMAGDLPKARRNQQTVHKIWRATTKGQWPGIIKYGLQLRGRSFSCRVTPPLREPLSEEKEQLKIDLLDLGVV